MPRRQGAFEDLLVFASKLPWQVGIGLALGFGLVFHFLAAGSSLPPTATKLGDLGSTVAHQFIHTFAFFLQFMVPAAFVFGAVASVFARSRSGALLAAAKANPADSLSSMSWRDFERLVGEAFRRRGYVVTGFGGAGPDGGVDLGLSKDGERFLVQCKHWRNRRVGVTVVRDLNGVIAAQGAHGGFVVTGGEFTRVAREFAEKTSIELIDGKALAELIGSVPTRGPAPKPAIKETRASAPVCPQCGMAMVRREAKQGKFAGRSFWGCGNYPKCAGVVDIS
jgi:restriction system protein